MSVCGFRVAAATVEGGGYVACTLGRGHTPGRLHGGHQYGPFVLDDEWFAARPCNAPVHWDGYSRDRCTLEPGHAGPHRK